MYFLLVSSIGFQSALHILEEIPINFSAFVSCLFILLWPRVSSKDHTVLPNTLEVKSLLMDSGEIEFILNP